MIIVLDHMLFPDSSYVLSVFVSSLSQSSLLEIEVANGCGLANSSCARLEVGGAIKLFSKQVQFSDGHMLEGSVS
jgi:hypothetical protein